MSLRTRLRPLDVLSNDDLRAWGELAKSSAASVPFLHPGFVLAAARWLTPGAPPIVLSIERGDTLIGLTCLQRRAATPISTGRSRWMTAIPCPRRWSRG